jgi:hypothetical protein
MDPADESTLISELMSFYQAAYEQGRAWERVDRLAAERASAQADAAMSAILRRVAPEMRIPPASLLVPPSPAPEPTP